MHKMHWTKIRGSEYRSHVSPRIMLRVLVNGSSAVPLLDSVSVWLPAPPEMHNQVELEPTANYT